MPGGTTGPNAMDEKTLKRLLRAEGTEAERSGRRCPDEALLSAYADHRIPDNKRAKVEAHLADCEACLGQVAFLARQAAEPAAAIIPGAVARARDLVDPAPGFWRPLVLRRGTAVAGIACLVLVVVVVLRQGGTLQAPTTAPVPDDVSAAPAPPQSTAPQQDTQPEAGSRKPEAGPATPGSTPPPLDFARGGPERAPQSSAGRAEGPPTVRNSAISASTLSVVAPAENATLSRQDLEFRWQAVPGSLYYEVSVMTDDGTVVWQGRADGTSARLPDGQRLEAGAWYFVRIRAHLAGGETIRSAAVSFHIGDW